MANHKVHDKKRNQISFFFRPALIALLMASLSSFGGGLTWVRAPRQTEKIFVLQNRAIVLNRLWHLYHHLIPNTVWDRILRSASRLKQIFFHFLTMNF